MLLVLSQSLQGVRDLDDSNELLLVLTMRKSLKFKIVILQSADLRYHQAFQFCQDLRKDLADLTAKASY